ncbi:hypothetical protein RCL10_11155 [Staphylococcus lloydii]|uniref:hypothetical protein n=1 Tax=Staphylococcus lloydii TaxID=2781774 RepID=UPI00292763B6|nr:hypothetical protein [Staphylococcus lloydii]MDU9419055.1 hypothetical protein [Staphylococcus lloydii]
MIVRKFSILVTLTLSAIMLASCGNDNSQSKDKHQNEEKDSTQSKQHDSNKHKSSQDNKESSNTHDAQNDNKAAQSKKSHLTQFNSEQIEYARVWNQLGPLKNNMEGMNELNVTKIAKGSKVNPNVKNSAVYPEDVVKLAAPMKAGGSVTYSSNGDGTINVYKNIPYNWVDFDSSDKADATKEAITKNIQTVKIKPTDNEQVAQLASKIKYQQ